MVGFGSALGVCLQPNFAQNFGQSLEREKESTRKGESEREGEGRREGEECCHLGVQDLYINSNKYVITPKSFLDAGEAVGLGAPSGGGRRPTRRQPASLE